jgi:O6-methylguanine-DNA--protein-cysteine methyltransferase
MDMATVDRVVGPGPVATPLGAFERSVHRSSDERRLAGLSAQLTGFLTPTLPGLSVPVDLRGTPFQLRVWQALLDLPYGETRSYAEVAATPAGARTGPALRVAERGRR